MSRSTSSTRRPWHSCSATRVKGTGDSGHNNPKTAVLTQIPKLGEFVLVLVVVLVLDLWDFGGEKRARSSEEFGLPTAPGPSPDGRARSIRTQTAVPVPPDPPGIIYLQAHFNERR